MHLRLSPFHPSSLSLSLYLFSSLPLPLSLPSCLSPSPFLFGPLYPCPSVCLHPPPPQLQDREALVSLLVGARYGLSQVVNHKLNMVSTLVDFSSISRVELLSESDRVSLLRISLHDIKVGYHTHCL